MNKFTYKIIVGILTIFFYNNTAFSQSVGIGITNPNAKSILELSSTTQGFLPPRMTTAQKTGLGLGAADYGMVVYDTDLSEFYYWYGAGWKTMGGADTDWTESGTNLYNGNTGNIGIGTSSPSEKLHVAGNVKAGAEVIGGTTVVYDIPLTGLVNMTTSCSAENYYDPGSGNSGIQWTSTGAGAVASMSIELNVGVDSHTDYTTLNTTLNASPSGTINTKNRHSSCAVRDYIFNISPSFANYSVGAVNQFLIIHTTNYGLGANTTWPAGTYARVTVNYGGTVVGAGDIEFAGALKPNGDAGTNGQVLTSDGSGGNTWATPTVTAPDGNGIYGGNGTIPSNTAVTVTDNINFDANTFYIDGASNEVGIGTASPTAKLHVSGTTTPILDVESTGSTSSMYLTNTTNYWSINNFSGEFRIGEGLTDRLTIEVGGEVGIGTVNPTSALEVVGDVEIPAANDYTYSTAQTRYITLNAQAFNLPSNMTTFLGFLGERGYLYATASSTSPAMLNLDLPQGATITNVHANFWDYDNARSAEVYLYRQGYNSTSTTFTTAFNEMAKVQSSSSVSYVINGILNRNTSTIANPVVDNANYGYMLAFWGGINNNVRLYSVRITYTVPKAD